MEEVKHWDHKERLRRHAMKTRHWQWHGGSRSIPMPGLQVDVCPQELLSQSSHEEVQAGHDTLEAPEDQGSPPTWHCCHEAFSA